MLATVITSVLLALAAIILRAVLGKKMNGRILMLMWAVVFLKFALPINIPSAVSVMNFFTQTQTVTDLPSEEYSEPIVTAPVAQPDVTYHIDVERPQVDVTSSQSETILPSPVETVQEKPLPDAEAVLKTVYISITAILCSAIIIAYIFCAVRFSRFEKVQSNLLQSNSDLRKGNIGTPAVFGIIRPKILLPYSTDFTDEVSLRHILLHETTHIRHRDPLWNVLTLLICAVNWYNPFVWVSRVLFLKDTERYCDETVVETIGTDNKKAYAESLLKCAAERSRMLMFVSGFGESDIKSRIKAVMSMKKVRTGTVIVLVLLIIISAAVFGTGKSLSAEITHSDFIPAGENQVYSQIVNGSNGETATINLTLDNDYGDTTPSNYYHFILDFDSEEYTLGNAHATFDIKGLTKYRLIPDEPVENKSEAIIEADFDKEKRDIELALYFDYQQETSLDVAVTYELKKGLFTVGEYTMQVQYKSNYQSFYDTIDSFNQRMENMVMFLTDEGYEIRNTDGKTDLSFHFNDQDWRTFTVRKGDKEKGFDTDFGGIDPFRTEFYFYDFNSDGVNDAVLEKYYSGTMVLDNSIIIINGATLDEIKIDTAAEDKLVKSFEVMQISSSKFTVSYNGKQHDFISSHQLENKAETNDDGTVNFGGGTMYTVENGVLYGNHAITIRDEKYGPSSTQGICNAKIEYEFKDGVLVPTGNVLFSGDTDYRYRAQRSHDIVWTYRIEGYDEPYNLQLVRVEELESDNPDEVTGSFALRLMSYEKFIAWCPFENFNVFSFRPELMDDMFIHNTENTGTHPGLVFFRQKNDDGLYTVSAYMADGDEELYPVKFRYEDGSYTETIQASENFTDATGGQYFYDSYINPNGVEIIRRYPYAYDGSTMVVSVVELTTERVLDQLTFTTAKQGDFVYTTEQQGNEMSYYPHVDGSYYDVTRIFTNIQKAVRFSQSNMDTPPANADAVETTFYCSDEHYFFKLYSNNVLHFRTDNTDEYYLLTDKEREAYLSAIEITRGGAVDYIAQNFANQLGNTDRSMSLMDALVSNEAYYTINGEEHYADPPSSWEIFKNVSVISDVDITLADEYPNANHQAIYRLEFEVNSLNPAPFKNGHNRLALVIGEPFESGATRIVKLADYDDYMHHKNVLSRNNSPEYAIYDYLMFASVANEFETTEDIPDETMLFYLLYSGEPWRYLDSTGGKYDGVTPERLKEASLARFGTAIQPSEESRYYNSETGRYYSQGMGIPLPEKYLFTETRLDGDYVYVTVEKYRGTCCLYLEKTLVFTLLNTDKGYMFVSAVAE